MLDRTLPFIPPPIPPPSLSSSLFSSLARCADVLSHGAPVHESFWNFFSGISGQTQVYGCARTDTISKDVNPKKKKILNASCSQKIYVSRWSKAEDEEEEEVNELIISWDACSAHKYVWIKNVWARRSLTLAATVAVVVTNERAAVITKFGTIPRSTHSTATELSELQLYGKESSNARAHITQSHHQSKSSTFNELRLLLLHFTCTVTVTKRIGIVRVILLSCATSCLVSHALAFSCNV